MAGETILLDYHYGSSIEEQPTVRRWQRDVQGWVTTRKWVGLAEDVSELVQQVRQDADDINVEQGTPLWTLIATYGDEGTEGSASGDAQSQEITWEVRSNTIEKPIASHPKFAELIETDQYFADIIAQIDSDLENKEKSEVRETDYDALYVGENGFVDPNGASPNKYRDFMCAGTDYYTETQPVIVKSVRYASRSTVQASYENNNRVEAPDVPTSAKFLLTTFRDQNGDPLEWLKMAPSVIKEGRKWNITQEWWGARWSKVLYGGSHTP